MGNMPVPALAHQGHHLGIGIDQGLEIRVVVCLNMRSSGAAKGTQHRLGEVEVLGSLEELHILRIGARPASLNEVDTQFIQLAGNLYLVLNRKGDALLLRPISKGSVIKLNL